MIRRHSTIRPSGAVAIATGIALLALAAPAAGQSAAADELLSASYVRTVDGRATLLSDRRGNEPADTHEPLLEGDRITVDYGARLEVELADRSRLHLAGGASLTLDTVAFSADGESRETALTLDDGELLLTVTDQALGDRLPTVRTPVADLFVHEPGRYRVEVLASAVEIVVREGFLEILTDRGSTVVRGGEAATIGRDRWQRVAVRAAGPVDGLERWSEALERGARWADSRELHVEPHLAYAAAPLRRHGTWIQVDTVWHWRPRVTVGWRPYWSGRWSWTPGGLSWVSYEPWGWVPYHYGTWIAHPRHGWVWRPGRVYRPAWVYWRIGPDYTAWCPVGYFAGRYGPRWGFGLRFGTYGWAGGGWGLYADWVFTPTRRVFERSRNPWRRSGAHLGRHHRGHLARGVLTTETRGVSPERWQAPDRLIEEVSTRARRRGGEIADVTDFVARRRELPEPVRVAVEAPDRGVALDRVAVAEPRRRGRSPEIERGREWARDRGRERRLDSGATAGAPGRRLGVDRGRAVGERSGRPVARPELDRRPAPKADPADRQAWRRDRVGGGRSGEARERIEDRAAGRRSPEPGIAPRRGREPSDRFRATEPRGRPDRGRSSVRPTPPVTRVIDGVRRGEPSDRGGRSPRAGATDDGRIGRSPKARADGGDRPGVGSRGREARPPAREPALRSRPDHGSDRSSVRSRGDRPQPRTRQPVARSRPTTGSDRSGVRSRSERVRPQPRQPSVTSRPPTGAGRSPVVDRSRPSRSRPVAKPSSGSERRRSGVSARPTPSKRPAARSAPSRGGSSGSKAKASSPKQRPSASKGKADKPPRGKSGGGKGDRDG